MGTVGLGEGTKSDVACASAGEQDFLFGGAIGEGTGSDSSSPRRAVEADIELVLADSSVGTAVLAWEVMEAAEDVSGAHIDLDFVWESSGAVVPLGMPDGRGIAVEGVGGGTIFADGFLAIDIEERPGGFGNGIKC